MFSHTRTNRFYKSKNLTGHDEHSSGVNLTLCYPSNSLSLNTISAPARQSRELSPSNDRDELQKPTLQRTLMKLSVRPEKEKDNEYEKEADDDFHPSSQQPSQPAHQGLEENLFDQDEDASTRDY